MLSSPQQHVLRQRIRQLLFDRPPRHTTGLPTLARPVVDRSRAPRADHLNGYDIRKSGGLEDLTSSERGLSF
jgi:hypothetical protein